MTREKADELKALKEEAKVMREDKGVLEQLAEKQNSLLAITKAWSDAIEALDKIRAEIADLDDADYDYEGYYKAVTDALAIIDKYRKE